MIEVRRRSVTVILASLTISIASYSQTHIQWASELDYQQNGFSEVGDWSGEKALGRPDALPQGQLSENAFRLYEKAVFGALILKYNKPQKVRYLVISENFNPGRIIEVFLFDEAGTRYPAYKTVVNKIKPTYRILVVDIPTTDYNVHKIEISINCPIHFIAYHPCVLRAPSTSGSVRDGECI